MSHSITEWRSPGIQISLLTVVQAETKEKLGTPRCQIQK